MRTLFIVLTAVILTASAYAIEIGDTYFPLDRPEVITAGGAYGANIDVADLIAAGTVTVVAFGYDT